MKLSNSTFPNKENYSTGVYFISIFLALILIASCKTPEKKEAPEESHIVAGTPVTITGISTAPLTEYIDLNATATFLQKNYIKANINGYIESINIQPGKYVNAGQELFKLKTKEAKSLNNSVTKLDPGFKFSGINKITASTSGYITQLSHQVGDYVQEGEQLAQISNENSFVFLLNLPFELRQYLGANKTVDLLLADGTKLKGTISGAMPNVDPASQTQSIEIRVSGIKNIPENLIAKVRLLKSNKTKAISLPKSALLTNDVQTEFWVMQLTDSTTAVKVAVKKGIETNGMVEILYPAFKETDKFLLTGNYGLPDTAKVVVEK